MPNEKCYTSVVSPRIFILQYVTVVAVLIVENFFTFLSQNINMAIQGSILIASNIYLLFYLFSNLPFHRNVTNIVAITWSSVSSVAAILRLSFALVYRNSPNINLISIGVQYSSFLVVGIIAFFIAKYRVKQLTSPRWFHLNS